MTLATPTIRALRCAVALVALGLGTAATAQTVVNVSPNAFGSLNQAVAANGSAIYVLERGGRYLLNGRITVTQPITIRAADGEGTLPVIQPGIDTGGQSDILFDLQGDMTLQGIYVLFADDNGARTRYGITVSGNDVELVVDESVFDYESAAQIRVPGAGLKLTMTNTVVRNVFQGGEYNGRLLDLRGPVPDSLTFQNNTFVNVVGTVVNRSGGYVPYFKFDHNTVYGSNHFLRPEGIFGEAYITNNVFANVGFIGDAGMDSATEGFDRAIVYFRELGNDAPEGVTEADRKLVATNNNYFYDQELLDFYAANDMVQAFVFLNERIGNIPDAADVTIENNFTEALAFDAAPPVGLLVDYVTAAYNGVPNNQRPVTSFDPDGIQTATLPLPEDFGYPTTARSYTAAPGPSGGCPIGDLNYFPSLKTSCTNFATAGETGPGAPGDGLYVRGTFPNPAAGNARLSFDLGAPASVSATVYDALGRVVASAPARPLAAGEDHRLDLDLSGLPAGLYLYRVAAESGTETFTRTGRLTVVR